jgi:hypothetical protein
MTIFAEKLRTLASTVRLGAGGPIGAIASALEGGAGRPAVAIGSGGSTIMAEYLARCRSTLGHGVTLVQTPMEFVFAQEVWADFDVWLFSAGANNPDVAGALTTALGSAAANVRLLTVNGKGATAIAAAKDNRVQLMIAPVAERKDGFLATHSLISMVTGMLAASDWVAKRSLGSDTVDRYAEAVERTVIMPESPIPDFRRGDTVVVLHDPQCRTLATLIETSLWETGIAPIQRADFRNFAHGRHVWAARHPDSMFILAITTALSRGIWKNIHQVLPEAVRVAEVDVGQAGRFKTAVSVVEGLMAIHFLGKATDTDPGKPGRGGFASTVYGDDGLAKLAAALGAALRHKLEAVQLHDNPACPVTSAEAARNAWLDAISDAAIGAIVLDYDGTFVTTDARLAPPSPDLVAELTRLADAGVAIAFATGRGGSAGEALRAALPQRLHSRVSIGYYNGGHIRPLNVDIEADPPPVDPDLAELADWIEAQALLKPGVALKRGRVQITINHADVLTPAAFLPSLVVFPAIAEGRIKRLSSHHSFDLLSGKTSKTAVSTALRRDLAEGFQVLAIGDSGEPGGNDTELLADCPSISVDGVCGHLDGSWSLFGRSPSGPAALLRILRALRVENGHARLDLNLLCVSLT